MRTTIAIVSFVLASTLALGPGCSSDAAGVPGPGPFEGGAAEDAGPAPVDAAVDPAALADAGAELRPEAPGPEAPPDAPREAPGADMPIFRVADAREGAPPAPDAAVDPAVDRDCSCPEGTKLDKSIGWCVRCDAGGTCYSVQPAPCGDGGP